MSDIFNEIHVIFLHLYRYDFCLNFLVEPSHAAVGVRSYKYEF